MSSYEVSNGGGSLLPSVIVIILVVTSIGVIVGMNSFQGTTNTTTESTTSSTSTTPETSTTVQTEPPTNPFNISYVDHNSISINGDADFASQADSEEWSGTGTSDHPFIIEGYRIAGERVSISIIHTTKHFIIRNCELLPEHTYITWGIDLWDSDNTLVEYCYIDADVGVDLLESTSSEVQYCRIYGDWVGVNVSYAYDVTVKENEVYNCEMGIWMDHSNNILLRDNLLEFNNQGVSILSSSDSGCIGNRIINNQIGIFSYGFQYYGLTTNYTMFYNSITGNSNIGIYLNEGTTGFFIYSNRIGFNHLNAQDNGTSNYWDGNAWSDYDGTGYYYISGPSESVDHSPEVLESTKVLFYKPSPYLTLCAMPDKRNIPSSILKTT